MNMKTDKSINLFEDPSSLYEMKHHSRINFDNSSAITNLLKLSNEKSHTPNLKPHNILGSIKQSSSHHKLELVIPNDLIGCVIGRGGSKINEIRQVSQANIKISNNEEHNHNRRVLINGPFSAVQCAKSLIDHSINLHKHLLALNIAMDSLVSKELQTNQQNITETEPGHINRQKADFQQENIYPSHNPITFDSTFQRKANRINAYEAIQLNPTKPQQIREGSVHPFQMNNQYNAGASQTEQPENYIHCDTQKILNLIAQLPQEKQRHWLHLFNLDL